MANPQTENGYTRIANELLEAVQQYKFTLNEMKIVMCVWRFTYGFQRTSHAMSLSFFENHTGITRSRVNAALKELVEKNVLKKAEQGNAKASNVYEFNKHYGEWNVEKYKIFDGVTSDQNDTTTSVRNDTITSDRNDTRGSVQDDTATSVQNDTQERKVKEILKKDIKTTTKKGPLVVDEGFAKLTNFYAENIGPLNRAIGDELSEMCDMLNSELALLALQKSVIANAKHKINYAFGILRSWNTQNFKTTSDVEQSESRNRNQSQRRGNNVTSLFEASPETLERQRREAEKYRGIEPDMTGLPY